MGGGGGGAEVIPESTGNFRHRVGVRRRRSHAVLFTSCVFFSKTSSKIRARLPIVGSRSSYLLMNAAASARSARGGPAGPTSATHPKRQRRASLADRMHYPDRLHDNEHRLFDQYAIALPVVLTPDAVREAEDQMVGDAVLIAQTVYNEFVDSFVRSGGHRSARDNVFDPLGKSEEGSGGGRGRASTGGGAVASVDDGSGEGSGEGDGEGEREGDSEDDDDDDDDSEDDSEEVSDDDSGDSCEEGEANYFDASTLYTASAIAAATAKANARATVAANASASASSSPAPSSSSSATTSSTSSSSSSASSSSASSATSFSALHFAATTFTSSTSPPSPPPSPPPTRGENDAARMMHVAKARATAVFQAELARGQAMLQYQIDLHERGIKTKVAVEPWAKVTLLRSKDGSLRSSSSASSAPSSSASASASASASPTTATTSSSSSSSSSSLAGRSGDKSGGARGRKRVVQRRNYCHRCGNKRAQIMYVEESL